MVRSVVRGVVRRWLPGVVALAATLALGLLFVPGAPFTFTARGRIVLGSMPESSARQHAERVLSDRVIEAALRASKSDPGDVAELRDAVSARRQDGSLIVELRCTETRSGRAISRVNAVGRAFEATAGDLAREESRRVLDEVDRALAERSRELGELEARAGVAPTAPPGAGIDERVTAEMLAGLERTLASNVTEAEALAVRLDVLTGRLERGDLDPARPADTAGSDRISRDLAAARLRLEEYRKTFGAAAPAIAELSARVEILKREHEAAVRRENLEARFSPTRSLLDAIRETTARRDALLRSRAELGPQIERLRGRLAALRGEPTAPDPAPDRGTLQSRLETARATVEELRERRAELASAHDLSRTPVERFEPAGDTSVAGAPLFPILGVAVLAGLAVALGFEAWTPTIRTDHDIRRYINLPLLGIIPLARPEEDRLLVHADEGSSTLEVFNTVATLVESRAKEDASKMFAITSAVPEEGKSTVACNLAVALAGGGAQVLLVDADLRRATQHRLLSAAPEPGLSSYLIGVTDEIDSAIAATSIENLFLLPAGPLMQSPHPYLRSERFRALVPELKERFDYVLFDLPPVRSAADGLLVAPLADGTILVVSAGETGKDDATVAKRLVRAARGRLIGCVLNKATVRSRGYYYYSAGVSAAAD